MRVRFSRNEFEAWHFAGWHKLADGKPAPGWAVEFLLSMKFMNSALTHPGWIVRDPLERVYIVSEEAFASNYEPAE